MPGTPTPKDRFTALDTLAVVRELRSHPRARVDKAFDLPDGGWSLALRVPGEGRFELLLVPGRYTALLPFGSERAEELSPFARDLRRVLTGAVLDRVTEPAGERSLEIGFTRGDAVGGILVLLEMFGTGNLTVSIDGKIVAVATSRRWAHRVVRVGAEYAKAPGRADPWELTAEAIEEILSRSRTDLTSTLGARLGLGGPLAEELAARLGADGQAPAALEAGPRARSLHAALATLRSDVGDRPKGFVYARDGALLDATPYPSARWKGVDGVVEETREHFSEASRDYFRTVVPAAPDVAALQASSERKEIDRMLVQQRAAVEQLEGEVARLQEQAAKILANYAEAEATLQKFVESRSNEPRVELVIGEERIPLLPGRSPRESAQELFEESKRQATKLAGDRHALLETETRASLPSTGEAVVAARTRARAVPPKKQFWFEKFRWFVSSEGAIVIAGRDAAS